VTQGYANDYILQVPRVLSDEGAGFSRPGLGFPRIISIVLLTRLAIAILTVTAAAAQTAAPGRGVEILRATGGLPAHIAESFDEPIGFAEATTGQSIVLDRRAHVVYIIDAAKKAATKLIQIGYEQGKILGPGVLALAPNDIFAVADAPNRVERIQFFGLDGTIVGGFLLESRSANRLQVGPLTLNGVGSMSFSGRTFLLNQAEAGSLITELDSNGHVIRRVGVLRPTGYEADRDLHIALNLGLPLTDPSGGYYFVFQTGVPIIRKYNATGGLVFERHIEGPELDSDIQNLPSTWPRRPSDRLPLVPPLVRTAAVDRSGRLWVSLSGPYTYVYDGRGEKIRTVQFYAAGLLSPASLFFTADNRLLVTPGCYEFSAK
jgi:hypothetical protein